MRRKFLNAIKYSVAAVAYCFVPFSSASADVINVDLSAVDPSAIPIIRAAEAVWESRIQAYSTELPRGIRDQLGSLYIAATVAPIDGPGGILGQAGPTAVISLGSNRRDFAVAVRAQMTFDLDDFPTLIADGTLQQVVVHEMGHALGFGSLFEANNLIGARGGFGQTEYINGPYAIQGYRQDLGNPVVSFVPLEQTGGAGTALGHWIDAPPFFNQTFTPAFKKEIMCGYLGDIIPGTQTIVYSDPFFSNATWGAMADLGFAVEGVNSAFAAPRGSGTGRWPKVAGSGNNPFEDNGVDPDAGLGFSLVTIQAVIKSPIESQGRPNDETKPVDIDDPYGLRKHRWVK